MLTMYAGQVVEDGQVRDILARPLHPYTAGLLGSIPQAVRRKSVLSAIPGRVPSVDEMPAGCRFAPRCAHAEPRCLVPQDLMESSTARHVRCCRFRELALTGAAA
jgi:peptide/nickel transport system ATP-binding protein